MPSMPSVEPFVYVDDEGRSDAERYFMGCLDGTYVVGRRVKKLAEKMLPRIRDGYKQWHFDINAATRPVRFIEKFCRIPSAKNMGKPFVMAPYERVVVETAFGFIDDDGAREFREVLVEWARKSGKTSLLAALNIYMLTSDGEGGAEVYNGATSESQARLCYGATNSMIEMSPQLKKRIRRGMVQKRGISGLNYDKTLSYLCTISSNSKKLDGLNTSFAVLDELAACEDGGATYDLLTESMSSRKSPMLFIISTENYVRENIWDERKKYAYGWLDDKIEDDTFLPFLYELDSRDEVWDERMWPKASPGLGITKDWDYLRNRVSKAQQSPARMPSLLTKEFNLPSNSYASFLSYEECVNRETYVFDATEFRYGIVGFDLADRGDLNAAVMMCMKPDDDHIYERAMFWIAEDQVEINSNSFKERDGVPYHQWAADGWIRIVPGNKVNQMVVIEWLRELVDEGVYPFAVGYDKWHVDDHTELELQRLVGETRARPVEQYAKVISPLMKEHRLDLRAKRIIDNDNPVLEWCRSNVNARADNNDNYFPQKKGLRPQNRIDGYMAELCAYGALKRNEEEYMQAIGW